MEGCPAGEARPLVYGDGNNTPPRRATVSVRTMIAAMLLEAGAKTLPLDWEGREHEVLKVKRERWATR